MTLDEFKFINLKTIPWIGCANFLKRFMKFPRFTRSTLANYLKVITLPTQYKELSVQLTRQGLVRYLLYTVISHRASLFFKIKSIQPDFGLVIYASLVLEVSLVAQITTLFLLFSLVNILFLEKKPRIGISDG